MPQPTSTTLLLSFAMIFTLSPCGSCTSSAGRIVYDTVLLYHIFPKCSMFALNNGIKYCLSSVLRQKRRRIPRGMLQWSSCLFSPQRSIYVFFRQKSDVLSPLCALRAPGVLDVSAARLSVSLSAEPPRVALCPRTHGQERRADELELSSLSRLVARAGAARFALPARHALPAL